MTKKTLLNILLDSIFLIVFNVVFFVLGGADRPASVWIAYGFIHLSYIMVVINPLLVRKSSSAAVFNFALSYVSTTYFIIEFIVGVIIILISSDSFVASLIIQIILFGIYAAILISNILANDATAESVRIQEAEVCYIKTVSSKVKMLINKPQDRSAQREIEKLYDLIHSSPTHSSSSVKAVEDQIQVKYYELEGAVNSNDSSAILSITKEFTSLLEERNRILRVNN